MLNIKNHCTYFLSICVLLMIFSCNIKKSSISELKKYEPVDIDLYNEIEAMDTKFFKAYNTCDLQLQSEIYSEDIEFFHDKGGLMTSKEALIDGTEKNICGKVTRTLLSGSMEVYPIKDFGAVEIGYHKFYNSEEPDAISRPSKFIIFWKKTGVDWKITKVVSLHN